MRSPTGLLLLLALSPTRAGAQTPDDAQTIRLRRESSNEAIARHDTAGIGAILAPDLLVVTSNSVHAVGRETNVRRFAEQVRTRPVVVYLRTPDEVRVFAPWGMASERAYRRSVPHDTAVNPAARMADLRPKA